MEYSFRLLIFTEVAIYFSASIMRYMYSLLLPAVLAFTACDPDTTGADRSGRNTPESPSTGTVSSIASHGATTSEPSGSLQAAPQVNIPGDPRDAWQKPEVLLAMMDNDVKDLVIADLFADDGYFSFRLAAAGARVIAVQSDVEKAKAMTAQRDALGFTEEQVEIRLSPVGHPGLAEGEADVALVVHSYTTIANRSNYFSLVRRGLAYPRPLFIIDWLPGDSPVAPAGAKRIAVDALMDEVGGYGYTDVGAHTDKMPYQVILFATDPMDE